jgi:hypothetical protein
MLNLPSNGKSLMKILVRDLTYLTPQVSRIIYFHVTKVNINNA